MVNKHKFFSLKECVSLTIKPTQLIYMVCICIYCISTDRNDELSFVTIHLCVLLSNSSNFLSFSMKFIHILGMSNKGDENKLSCGGWLID